MSKQTTLFQTWGYSGNEKNFPIAASLPKNTKKTIEEDQIFPNDDGQDEFLVNALEETSNKSFRDVLSSESEYYDGFDENAGRTWIYPTNYPIRSYQYSIVTECLFKNTLVSLPTGLGKTFIAAVVMYNFYRWYPKGKIIFMAPTKALVAQQIEACFKIMGIPQGDTSEMTGNISVYYREKAWKSKRVFFLTPQVMSNDLTRGLFPVSEVKCVVVDEAHRAQGEYAYCQVVKELTLSKVYFRVVALSATPGSDIAGVQSMISNLCISHVELKNEDSPDILPYTFSRNITKIVVPIGAELEDIKQQFLSIVEIYYKRLSMNKAIRANMSVSSISKFGLLQSRNEFRQNPPPSIDKMRRGLVESDFASSITLCHALELLLQHGLRSFYNFLAKSLDSQNGNRRLAAEMNRNPVWIELKGLLSSKFDSDSKVEKLNSTHIALHSQFSQAPESERSQGFELGHPKLEKLRDVVLDHFKQKDNEGTKIMIFSQYRDSVTEITACLHQFRPLVKVMEFVGQAGTKGKKGLTQKEQIEVIKRFREGGYNTLVSTCVGEEGLDIGEVDLIICFDVSKSPIRHIQRMGRTGRKRAGKIVVLVTKGKEEHSYNQCLYSKKSINKAITEKNVLNSFLTVSPRMVPTSIIPECHKMKMIDSVYDSNLSSIKNNFSKSETTKTSEGLSDSELSYWRKNYQTSQHFSSYLKLPKREEFWKSIKYPDTDGSIKLDEWSLWQKAQIPNRRLVSASSLTRTFESFLKLLRKTKSNNNLNKQSPKKIDKSVENSKTGKSIFIFSSDQESEKHHISLEEESIIHNDILLKENSPIPLEEDDLTILDNSFSSCDKNSEEIPLDITNILNLKAEDLENIRLEDYDDDRLDYLYDDIQIVSEETLFNGIRESISTMNALNRVCTDFEGLLSNDFNNLISNDDPITPFHNRSNRPTSTPRIPKRLPDDTNIPCAKKLKLNTDEKNYKSLNQEISNISPKVIHKKDNVESNSSNYSSEFENINDNDMVYSPSEAVKMLDEIDTPDEEIPIPVADFEVTFKSDDDLFSDDNDDMFLEISTPNPKVKPEPSKSSVEKFAFKTPVSGIKYEKSSDQDTPIIRSKKSIGVLNDTSINSDENKKFKKKNRKLQKEFEHCIDNTTNKSSFDYSKDLFQTLSMSEKLSSKLEESPILSLSKRVALISSDSDDDFIEGAKNQKKIKNKRRKILEEYVHQEAEISKDCSTSDGDDENSDLDNFDASFVDDQTQSTSINTKAMYLESLKNSKIKTKKVLPPITDDIYSQMPDSEELNEEYENDSFCVDNDFIEFDTKMDTLDVLDVPDESVVKTPKVRRKRIIRVTPSTEEKSLPNSPSEASTSRISLSESPSHSSNNEVMIVNTGEIHQRNSVISSLRHDHGIHVKVSSFEGCSFIISTRLSADIFSYDWFMNGANKQKILQKCQSLNDLFEKPFIILESSNESSSNYKSRSKQGDGVLSQLARSNIRLLYSNGSKQSAGFLAKLLVKESSRGFALRSLLTSDLISNDQEFKVMTFYKSLPGIGAGTAYLLASNFKNVSSLSSCALATLMRKGNLEKSKAQNLYNFFRNIFEK